MARIVRTLLTLLLVAYSGTASAQGKTAISPDVLYARSKSSVVTILTFDSNNAPLAQGSGFIVAHDRIITNYHVIKDCSSVSIVFDNGVVIAADTLTAASEAKDLAILPVPTGTRAPLQLGNELDIKIGQSVFAIGTPEGLSSSLSNGIVSGFRQEDGQFLIQITASITHGSSGGPLFNAQGQVIGVTSSGLKDRSFGFAVGAGDIRQLLKVPLPVPAKLAALIEKKPVPGEKKPAPSEKKPSSTSLATVQGFYDTKRYQAAEKAFAGLSDDVKNSYDGQLLLCRIQVGEPEPNAGNGCRGAIVYRPTEATPYRLEAEIDFKYGNLEEAGKNVAKALELSSQAGDVSNRENDDQFLAVIGYAQGNYSAPVRQISEDNKSVLFLTTLAGAAIHTGDQEKYHSVEAKISSLSGKASGWQHYIDGVSAANELNWKEAKNEFKACEGDKNIMDPACAVGMAHAEFMLGYGQLVQMDIDDALIRYSQKQDLLREGILVNVSLGNREKASSLRKQLVHETGGPDDFVDCLYYYGFGDPETAKQYCDAETIKHANSYASWRYAGYVALDLGQYQVASADFAKAGNLYAADGAKHAGASQERFDILLGMFIAASKAGDKKQARAVYLEIKSQYPYFGSSFWFLMDSQHVVWSRQTKSLITSVTSTIL